MGSGLPTRFKTGNRITQHHSTNNKHFITGDHEPHVSEGSESSEGELHTREKHCEKNPGHTKFIPVDQFTLEHLPEGQRDNDMYEYIKGVADMTVKVNVYKASPQRPEYWPYPFYMREQDCLRTGSGMMYLKYKFTNGVKQDGEKHWENCTKCWCKKCEHSDSPSNVWWEFDVYTAAHVVFDDFEASHTTIKLFFDSKDSPLVIVDKVRIMFVNIKYDRCRLRCVTCDKNLGDKLEKLSVHYLNVWYKVEAKYKDYKAVNTLTFIVSHPHGCTKQVSIGHWMKKHKVDKVKRMYTYTTCTCPGSSGALVYCVGFNESNRSYYLLVHSGANSNHNYSGVGW